METAKLNRIIKYASRFTQLHLAKSYSGRTIKPSAVLMGDDGYFWVLPIGKADLLHRHGYEYAE